MATHCSILAWRIPWTEKPDGAPVHGVAKSRTRLNDEHTTHCVNRSVASVTRIVVLFALTDFTHMAYSLVKHFMRAFIKY